MYTCPFCGRSFNTLHAVKTHVKLKHFMKDDPVCPCCSYRAESWKGLVRHATMKYNDECHKALYYLLVASGNDNTKTKTRRREAAITARTLYRS